MVETLEKKSLEFGPSELSLNLICSDGRRGGVVRMRIKAREYLRTLSYDKVLSEVSRTVDILKADKKDHSFEVEFPSVVDDLKYSFGGIPFSSYRIDPSEYISVALEILKEFE